MSRASWLEGAPWVALAFVAGAAVTWAWLDEPPPAPEPTPAQVYAAWAPSVVRVSLDDPEHRLGAGFAVSPTRVVTARHLVVGAKVVQVRPLGGEVLPARVVGTDARTDMALLDVPDGADLVPVELGSTDALAVGDPVLAIGHPFGLDHSLAVGVVGGWGRRLEGDPTSGDPVEYLQLALALNPGNSGGPLFDASGRVVGVLAGLHAKGQAISFAVPVETLRETLPELERGLQVSRAFLGVRTELGADGVVVTSVVPSGPADRAGVRVGDLLTEVDGVQVASPEDLRGSLGRRGAGDEVRLGLERGGAQVEVTVVLTDRDARAVVAAGMVLRPVPGAGGEVVAVRPDSRAARAGVQAGDVVRAVGGLPVQAPADVAEALARGQGETVEALRGGVPVILAF